MATRKIVLKTASKRRGTISRATVRSAVQSVFGATALLTSTKSPNNAAKVSPKRTALVRSQASR